MDSPVKMPHLVLCQNVATCTPEDEERYKKLFEKLDANKDGRIEVNELAAALQKQSVSKKAAAGHAKVS